MTAPNFISLFSGAGGLDHGFELAGWRRLLASDIDRDAAATLRLNTKKAARETVLEGDIREQTASELMARAGGVSRGEVTAIVGGPPCQSWSSAGHQLGMADDRGRLFFDFIKLANQLDPRFIVMENVRGLLTARGPDGEPGSALALIREDLRKEGWQTSVSVLNSADFGVPQRRVRLFIIAHRNGDSLHFPEPTHSKSPSNGEEKWVSMRSCLSTIRALGEDEIIRPTGKLASELIGIPPGSGVKSPGKAETTRPGGHWGYKQGAFVADMSLPARTVTASTAQDWIIDPQRGLRRLCPRECAAIQTFPPRWKWAGGKASMYRQIGNAVPPKLAQRIATTLAVSAGTHVVRSDISKIVELEPLAPELQGAINYTMKEEARNGNSRRSAPARRVKRTANL
ncbi:DNA cytosine methyltransferase [Leisingera sp. M527]|uniref:DNA cytosine methyltransferase n=1 Tax=Leisingera sp. M527 TaxID=2867014 RepID=UPI0021A5F139|nr:DNA cytosine methyltransferase [Leisingera sp. M527]UWQ31305.1 DNA cytosine methyltransferase [Leisingera sp. M527]